MVSEISGSLRAGLSVRGRCQAVFVTSVVPTSDCNRVSHSLSPGRNAPVSERSEACKVVRRCLHREKTMRQPPGGFFNIQRAAGIGHSMARYMNNKERPVIEEAADFLHETGKERLGQANSARRQKERRGMSKRKAPRHLGQ